jgi:hypothetical protein
MTFVTRATATALALLLAGSVQAAEITLLSAGFEAPTFTAGNNIHNQAGWKADINAAVNYDATVSTARSATGSQSLRMVSPASFPSAFASYSTFPNLISLGGTDLFFMTAKVYVEEAATGGWGLGLTTGIGGLVGMSIAGDGRLSYAHMNSPVLSFADTGLALLDTWVTLTMRRDAAAPGQLVLDVSTDAGSWSGFMGMPTTTNSAFTFFVGGSGSAAVSGSTLRPLAYYDDVRVGYNMAVAAPPNPPLVVPAPATLLLVVAGLAAMRVQNRSPGHPWQ